MIKTYRDLKRELAQVQETNEITQLLNEMINSMSDEELDQDASWEAINS